MELVKKTKEYTIFKKNNNRYGVKGPKGKWINKDEKENILLKEKLITKMKAAPKPAAEEEATESDSNE